MNLDTLEQLADARLERKYCCNDPDCSCRNARDNFIYEITPATIKSLIALCKLQHEMISKEFDYQLRNDTEVQWHILKALAAFYNFSKGE